MIRVKSFITFLVESSCMFLVIFGLLSIFVEMTGYNPLLILGRQVPYNSFWIYQCVKAAVAAVIIFSWLSIIVQDEKPKMWTGLLAIISVFYFFI